MEKNKLNLAPEKTESIILRGKRIRNHATFNVGATKVTPKKFIKYLGITLDQRLTFGEHIKNVTRKAEDRIAILSRVLLKRRAKLC